MEKNIAVIKGDGIGPEIVNEAMKVLDAVAQKYNHTFHYQEILMGGCSIDAYGVPLTDEALNIALKNASLTQDQIKDEVIKTAELIRKWIDSEEAKRPINSFLITSKAYIEQFLHTYIQNEVPLMINKMLNSDELIKWFKENAMPSMQKKLTIWLESDGCKLIVENFNIRKRILEAVDKQDIKEFQDMIDNVASEHLGTIQVLGYVLGLIFGSILFFC